MKTERHTQALIGARIKEYLISKVKETFPEDYKLIEGNIEQMVDRYSLKELIMYARLEIQRIRNRPDRKFSER